MELTVKNKIKKHFSAVLFFAIYFSVGSLEAQTQHWVTAYYTGWETGTLPANSPAIVWPGVTVIAHFALSPNSDGTINYTSNGLEPSYSSDIITAGHNHNVKVIVTVGGAGTESSFMHATNSSTLSTFVSNIVNIVKSRGYDGVDIDWEPISQPDITNFTNLTKALRQALPPPYLLSSTSGVGSPYSTVFASLQSYFDQINIMTYDLAGNWQDWVSWYNGSVGTWGVASTNGAESDACCATAVEEFIKAGVAPGKIGIGSEWGGTIWTGVTGPNQKVVGNISVSYDQAYSYIKSHFTNATYHWDTLAQASYLSTSNQFISYDDTADINAKFELIRTDSLGGLIIWTLGMGYTGKSNSFPMMDVLAENLSGSGGKPPVTPGSFVLYQNYPNPFNGITRINYTLPASTYVTLKIFDILGREIKTLVNGYQSAGNLQATFDAGKFSSGVYFYRISDGPYTATRKMLLLK